MSDDPQHRSPPNLGGVRPGESLRPQAAPRRNEAPTWLPASRERESDRREPPPFDAHDQPVERGYGVDAYPPAVPEVEAYPDARDYYAPQTPPVTPRGGPTLEPRWEPAGITPHQMARPQNPAHAPAQATAPPRPSMPPPVPPVPMRSAPVADAYPPSPRTGPPTGPQAAPRGMPPPAMPQGQPQPQSRVPLPPRTAPPAQDFRGPRTIYKAPEHAEATRSSPIGKVVRYSLLALLAVILLGVGTIVFAPPTELIRDQVIAEVKAKTGRDLQVGSTRLTFVPSLGVSLRNVTLSAPPTMPGAPLLTAKGIEVNLALMPLITRDVQIERLVLVEPVIDLRVDQTGRRSWDFAEAEPLRQTLPIRHAQTTPPRGQDFRKLPAELQDFAKNTTTPPKAGSRLGVSALSLVDVRISDGRLRYADQRSGVQHEAQNINTRLSLKDLGGPLTVNGDLVYAKEKFNVDASVFSLRELIEERGTKIAARLDGQTVAVNYEGEIIGGGSGIDGRLNFKTPSAAGLAKIVQLSLPGLEGLGAIAIEGQVKTGAGSVAFNNATFQLGDFTASGALAVDVHTGRPQIKTTLKIAKLDLDRLAALRDGLGTPVARPRVAQPEPAPSALPKNTQATPVEPAQSIEDLLKQTETETPRPAPGTAVRGFTRREGWNQEAIDLGHLRLVDLDGRFAIGTFTWNNIQASQIQLVVDLKGGFLKLNIQETELYGGRGRGLVNLDARQDESTLGLNISADGVAAAGLLRDAAGSDMLEGRGKLLIAVTSKGVSERDLIGALTGKVDFTMADGAIVGWDANELIGQMSQLKLPKFDRRPGARTPYSQLAATFQIANGVGRTQDLRFVSPSVQATGTGVVNLVDRNLNLLVKPKVASGNLANIDVPLRIAGNFDAINVVPEGKSVDTLKQIGRQVREQDVDNVVRGVLGDSPEAQEKAVKAKELLRRFLKQ